MQPAMTYDPFCTALIPVRIFIKVRGRSVFLLNMFVSAELIHGNCLCGDINFSRLTFSKQDNLNVRQVSRTFSHSERPEIRRLRKALQPVS